MVVGNPMFSANETNSENKSTADLATLDDLQLDMDYDQIMHYFDNLKVNKNITSYYKHSNFVYSNFL